MPTQRRTLSGMNQELWRAYFSLNAVAPRGIPWERGADLHPDEARFVIPSLQEFQIGESSDGAALLSAAVRWARRPAAAAADAGLPEVLALFVAEERRHAAELARFLRLNGHPSLKRSAAAGAFRMLRQALARTPHALEGSLAVLMTAEVSGYVYYAALRSGTRSATLRALCDVFLRDETAHLMLHADLMSRLRRGRSPAALWLTRAASRTLMAGVCLVVWARHRRVLAAGRLRLAGFAAGCFTLQAPALPAGGRLGSLAPRAALQGRDAGTPPAT